MNKILIIAIAFWGQAAAVSAQDKKLSKEETIAFLESTIKGANYGGFIVDAITLKDDSLASTEVSAEGQWKRVYSPVKWNKLFMVQKVGSAPADGVIIELAFAEKMKYTESGIINKVKVASTKEVNAVRIAIPAAAYHRVREAFFRLGEIFKGVP